MFASLRLLVLTFLNPLTFYLILKFNFKIFLVFSIILIVFITDLCFIFDFNSNFSILLLLFNNVTTNLIYVMLT